MFGSPRLGVGDCSHRGTVRLAPAGGLKIGGPGGQHHRPASSRLLAIPDQPVVPETATARRTSRPARVRARTEKVSRLQGHRADREDLPYVPLGPAGRKRVSSHDSMRTARRVGGAHLYPVPELPRQRLRDRDLPRVRRHRLDWPMNVSQLPDTLAEDTLRPSPPD